MITELLYRQVHKELQVIYENLYSFVKHFYNDETADLLNETEYLPFLGPQGLYVQQHWTDEFGENCVLEIDIDIKDYNEWFKGLNDTDVSKG